MRHLTLLLLFVCTACSSASPPLAPAAAAPDHAAALLAQIRALVGPASCTDSSQCRTVPLGVRACGGPEAYLAWSSTHTPEAPLRALAERYKQTRQAALAKSGELSDCRFIPDPGAQCEAGVCHLGSSGPDRS